MKIDYEFYITNQIMKPALQFLELAIPDAAKMFDKYKETFKKERMEEDMKIRVKLNYNLRNVLKNLMILERKLIKLIIKYLKI